jgi:hypothetical protein
MCFRNGDFSGLEILNISGKKVYIVNDHQYVLPIWGEYVSRNGGNPIKLITFDYHTDTRRGFRHYMASIGSTKGLYDSESLEKIRADRFNQINVSRSDSLIKVADDITNDEHIMTAHELGIIGEYHVINCSDTEDSDMGYFYKERFCQSCVQVVDCNNNCPSDIERRKNARLDDNYLESTGFVVPDGPFILDFDLDYFPLRNTFAPSNSIIINRIIQLAKIITIACEPNYFESLKEEDFSFIEAKTCLLKLIENALNVPNINNL